MQAITIAIGKMGIDFFARQFLANKVVSLLAGLNPPNRTIPIDSFGYDTSTDEWSISNMTVQLANGQMNGYSPAYQSILQGLNNGIATFNLTFPAGAFTANYKWTEAYAWEDIVDSGDGYPSKHTGNTTNSYSYTPSFNSLTVQVIVQFAFNSGANAWQVTVQSANGDASGESANIPGDSVLQNQESGNCSFSTHVSNATAQAIDGIDFANPVNQLISGVLRTIPSSGNLGNGIIYDFSIGDSGLLFPNNDGIQMGVKGGANYNGTNFSGSTPPSLPLPAPLGDSDSHHLNMYVSNYEVDALQWAYMQAGKLNLVINPQDLPDPAALNVSNYVALEAALKPYSGFVMQAQITQNSAPTTSFQTVYIYSNAVMTLLQQQLPSNIYQLILAISTNAYLSKSDLEAFLTGVTVPGSYFAQIENAGLTTAMVVSQNMDFNLVIQNGQPTKPYIKFGVTRADVLTELQLGASVNNTQTMQYGFANANNVATFSSSSIPGFDGTVFGSLVWPISAEPLYAQNLIDMGKTGVPLPIMQGFQFDFTDAQLSVQQGYVSILANVQLTNS